jgi:transcriptional regulator with XRE-family HTH domain
VTMGKTLKERLEIAMRGPPRVRAIDLARACNVRPPSVSDWLTGKTKRLEGANLLNAAKRLGVTPEWLATGKGPRYLNAPGSKTADNLTANRQTESQPLTIDPDILHEALTLLVFDEQTAGAYPPRSQSRRLADLYGRVAADGGKLTDAHNELFVQEVLTRGIHRAAAASPSARRVG